MRQTKADTELTRQALLDAAEKLFWERGPASTSVLDIARAAQLTRGAFYHHFKDKTAIFEVLLVRARALDKGLSSEGEDDTTDALTTLREFCKNVFELFVEDPFQQRMFGIVMHRSEVLGDLEPLARIRREEICRSVHTYERLLRRAEEAGRLAQGWTPPIAAMTLYSTVIGLLDQWMRARDEFDVRGIGIACLDQLFDAFERHPDGLKGLRRSRERNSKALI